MREGASTGYKRGDKVRILIKAGVLPYGAAIEKHGWQGRPIQFTGAVMKGTVGIYLGAHPVKRLRIVGWHLIMVAGVKESANGKWLPSLVVPVTLGQFEQAGEEEEDVIEQARARQN